MTSGQRWAVATAVLIGMAVGLGTFTFGYARGYSYITDDPAACANCHVMNDHFSAWMKGSHRAVATCNDCHTPKSLVPKYVVKAQNGFWHSFYFTVGGYPDPLRITEGNRKVAENSCLKCHAAITSSIGGGPHSSVGDKESLSCITCHRQVGHMVR
jgi:cytochrome c nitrite reductase small subunit